MPIRTIQLNLPQFTLIGATTRAGLLTSPLRARFGVVNRLDFYEPGELKHIVLRSGRILQVGLNEEAAIEIARRSRGTPRIANRLLRRIRDFAQISGVKIIELPLVKDSLQKLDVDEQGLDEMDKRILLAIIEKFGGGPVGLNTLAVAIGEEGETVEEIYEPYLIQQGLLARTPRGRAATEIAYRHLGKKMNPIKQQSLFN